MSFFFLSFFKFLDKLDEFPYFVTILRFFKITFSSSHAAYSCPNNLSTSHCSDCQITTLACLNIWSRIAATCIMQHCHVLRTRTAFAAFRERQTWISFHFYQPKFSNYSHPLSKFHRKCIVSRSFCNSRCSESPIT